MKKVIAALLVAALVGVSGTTLYAQDGKDAALVKEMMETKNFVFKAETAIPQQGRVRQLTSEFDFTVTGDSVISFLPFFGRAYVAPINPTDGGIKFTSTRFDYKSVPGRKEGWEITITPQDAGSVQQVFLSVFENGRATLRVNDRNRQGISFNGYVVQGREKAKKAF